MAANSQAICDTAKTDFMNGLHAFGASVIRAGTTKDTFYAALFVTNNSMGAATTAYSSSGEVTNGSGTGYTAGGLAVTNANPPSIYTHTASWTPSASFVWTAFTSAAAFDTCLLYNNTASGKNAVAVYCFGAQSITSGTFTLSQPTDGAATGLLRIA
ncbi:MAG TPA: hypothetical protein VNR65_04630 [Geobacterales bacterium]|nr:hypothetical protein [Geobacterales bacterium]